MQTPSSMWHDCIPYTSAGLLMLTQDGAELATEMFPGLKLSQCCYAISINLRIETQYEKCGGKGGQYRVR